MNNKGFAITTILYGTLILFLMLLLSLLGILSSYKDRLSILIDKTGAARTHIMSARFERPEPLPEEEYGTCYVYEIASRNLHMESITTETQCYYMCNDWDIEAGECERSFDGGVDSSWNFETCTLGGSGWGSNVKVNGIECN